MSFSQPLPISILRISKLALLLFLVPSLKEEVWQFETLQNFCGTPARNIQKGSELKLF